MGLALWLCPSPSAPAATQLSELIQELAKQHETYHFDPHITLLAGIPANLEAALKSALQDVAPFQISYGDLGTHHTFFQYLFTAVEKSKDLAALRSKVRSAVLPQLPAEASEDYFPHLSLMYGEDTEQRKVQEIIQELQKERGEAVARGSGFRAESVSIVRCEGPPSEWRALKVLELGQ